MKTAWRSAAVVAVLFFLSGCNSGDDAPAPPLGDPTANAGSAGDPLASAETGGVQIQAVETVAAPGPDSLVLLLPDDALVTDPLVTTWVDAAREEGLHLGLMSDSQFLALGDQALQYAGFILPDAIHQRASDEFVAGAQAYVSAGGKLMLVFDAGVLDAAGFYPLQDPARFSPLAGVDYCFYNEFYAGTIPTVWGLGPVVGMEKNLWAAQVAPGKSMPYSPATVLSSQAILGASDLVPPLRALAVTPRGLRSADADMFAALRSRARLLASRDFAPLASEEEDDEEDDDEAITAQEEDDEEDDDDGTRGNNPVTPLARYQPSDALHAVSTYGYGYAIYPSYITRGTFDGTELLRSPEHGLIAGQRNHGQGRVLFVNIPLGYLKNWGTDGMLMHGFLRYFAVEMLGLPRLSQQPNGRGGLVLNWHVDSAVALEPNQRLDDMGVWTRGKFSIDITAGPDAIVPGDGLGLDVPNNPTTQFWLRRWASLGHEVGSHGGWVHDYFASTANETNADEFLPLLVQNKQAVEAVTGKPVIEYSPPGGNNPTWALDWLEDNGFVSYYTVSHTGMGPTIGYREGTNPNPSLWAFPVTPFGKYATFEEFQAAGLRNAEIQGWLTALMDFTVEKRTGRLIYFHPQGAVEFPGVISQLFARADTYASAGEFHWYTAVDLARFNDSRTATTWSATRNSATDTAFRASHPIDLATQTWLLPKTHFLRPSVTTGTAQVSEDPANWIVTAGTGTSLEFTATNAAP